MEPTVDETLARWPALKPLLVMIDPPWQFTTMSNGVLSGTRTHESYVEALWVIGEERAGMSRAPIPNRAAPAIVTVNFSGPLHEAIELLRRPARWESDA
jgi:hypothetical protein